MKKQDVAYFGFLLFMLVMFGLYVFNDAQTRKEKTETLRFMAENGYTQKWEPNSRELIWTKEVK